MLNSGTDSINFLGVVNRLAPGQVFLRCLERLGSSIINFGSGLQPASIPQPVYFHRCDQYWRTVTYSSTTTSTWSSWLRWFNNHHLHGWWQLSLSRVVLTLERGGTNIFHCCSYWNSHLRWARPRSQPSADYSFRNHSVDTQAPSQEGAFFYSLTPAVSIWLLSRLQPNQRRCLLGSSSSTTVIACVLKFRCLLLLSWACCSFLNWWRVVHRFTAAMVLPRSQEPLSAFAAFQSRQPEPLSPKEAWQQLLPVADLPDALLFWAYIDALPASLMQSQFSAFCLLQRLAMLLHQQRPGRPDLPYQVLMREATGPLLKTVPKQWLQARPLVFQA